MDLDFLENAVPTLHTRVESWECDLNGHWNTRFYVRSFQNAIEAAGGSGSGRPGQVLHFRFHSEMLAGDCVTIRSTRSEDGRAVHVMTSGQRLVATAVELPVAPNDRLPVVPDEHLGIAFPRGLTDAPVMDGAEGARAFHESGPVWQAEIDHRGRVLPDEILRRCGTINHVLMSETGFDADYIRRTRIGRMLVEMRMTIVDTCAVGSVLRTASRGPVMKGKTFTTTQSLLTQEGTLLAVVEFCMVAVDLNTRKAVDPPDILGVSRG